MQDANTLAWTSAKASAVELARGPESAPYWQAPVPLESVVGNKTAPREFLIHARVNHGIWIVDCPDCTGAQFACPDDHRFMCNYCGNAMLDGLWRPVEWPKNRAAIDEVLMKRKMPNQRHWKPLEETITDLKAENIEHGVSA